MQRGGSICEGRRETPAPSASSCDLGAHPPDVVTRGRGSEHPASPARTEGEERPFLWGQLSGPALKTAGPQVARQCHPRHRAGRASQSVPVTAFPGRDPCRPDAELTWLPPSEAAVRRANTRGPQPGARGVRGSHRGATPTRQRGALCAGSTGCHGRSEGAPHRQVTRCHGTSLCSFPGRHGGAAAARPPFGSPPPTGARRAFKPPASICS